MKKVNQAAMMKKAPKDSGSSSRRKGTLDTGNTKRTKNIIYEAGGGHGRHGLSFGALADEQREMYRRTLHNQSEVSKYAYEQEQRQMINMDRPIHVKINVSREDFPVSRNPIYA